MVKCTKWKKGCFRCPLRKESSWFFDRSKEIQKRKKRAVDGANLTIVSPSIWLAKIVEESFLGCYPIKVINNGIDLNVFHPTCSSFRNKYGITEHCFILLGVAFDWGQRKGLDVFIELSRRLDNSKFKFVLVGTTERIDAILPSCFISIHKTNNQKELAAIYTAADLFVNPTREENYPTVNMESIACGTPVLTFRTGGSPEMINQHTGVVVDCDDVDSMLLEIQRIERERPFTVNECVKNSMQFNAYERYMEYYSLI